MAVASEFCTTHWSVVCRAGTGTSPEATAALETLCRTYWRPVYYAVRRRGHGPQNAEDLTQDFFAELLNRGSFAGLDPAREKFRSFLLACLNHFLAKEWRGRNTLKRGGGKTLVPIDAGEAEELYAGELAAEADPPATFDRQWAIAILDQTMSALLEEQTAGGKGNVFEEVRQFLTVASANAGYEEAARRLQMSVGAVATAVHRLRHRYRELVREVIAQTVNTPLELEEEMRHLLRVLSQ
jgi:RNA polymerase sigma-70 factor (ECF subfamily)